MRGHEGWSCPSSRSTRVSPADFLLTEQLPLEGLHAYLPTCPAVHPPPPAESYALAMVKSGGVRSMTSSMVTMQHFDWPRQGAPGSQCLVAARCKTGLDSAASLAGFCQLTSGGGTLSG
jgi:hypothetical protein